MMLRARTIACLSVLAGCAAAKTADHTPPGAPSSAPSPPSFGFSVDVLRRACKADAECQVIASCDCGRCIPSRRMDVDICPPPLCTTDACAGKVPRCDHGLCSVDGYADFLAATTARFMDDVTHIGQRMFDAPRVADHFRANGTPVVAWEPRVAHPQWTALGKPVEIAVGVPEKGPTLLPELWIEGDKASVTFWCEPEGMAFHGQLARSRTGWSLVSVDATPRRP
jgi:hypothetical protein